LTLKSHADAGDFDSCASSICCPCPYGECTTFGGWRREIAIRCPAMVWVANHERGQRPDREVFFQTIADRPLCYPKGIFVQITQGNDAPGMQIKDDGQIDPAFVSPDVSNIACLSPGIRYAVSMREHFWLDPLA
jgi:hypothetical protein